MGRSEVCLQEVLAVQALKPRRMKLIEKWPDFIHPPSGPGRDPWVKFRFEESYWHCFSQMVEVRHRGLRYADDGRPYIYVQEEMDSPAMQSVQQWYDTVGQFVANRDTLTECFSLDFDKERGDPKGNRTEVGELRQQAKTYGKVPTEGTYEAARKLADLCTDFLGRVWSYDACDSILAMPGSDPGATYNLPRYVVRLLADSLSLRNLEASVTSHVRSPLKEAHTVEEKLEILKDSNVSITGNLEGATILLVDDLYQSGVSLNYLACLLRRAGAKTVFGLTFEKTCKNDAN